MDVVAEVVRSGFVETRHRGTIVRVDAAGDVDWSIGDPDVEVFPRSCNKPWQALGMLRAGLPLDGRLLALASASHSGEAFHVAAVHEILARAGLDETALRCPASLPIDREARRAWLATGAEPAPICMDCSGKHAAMLLTCVANGWSVADYLSVDHPLQRVIAETFSDAMGAPPSVVGVDGCGAPLFATSLARLARATSALLRTGGDARRLVEAVVASPEYLSGTGRPELQIMRTLPGAVAKSGAQACFIAGLPDGTALALKVEDGADDIAALVMARALQLAGHTVPGLVDPIPVRGGGKQVGQIRPSF